MSDGLWGRGALSCSVRIAGSGFIVSATSLADAVGDQWA
jgi:hypothetical protein